MADETPTTTASSTSSPPSSDGKDGLLTVHLTVTGLQGSPRIPIQVAKDVTSTQLRQQVCKATSIPPASLRLIFRGRMIPDGDDQLAVSVFKLEDGSVLHCMGKPSAAPTTGEAGAGASNAVPVTAGSLATATAAATTGAPTATASTSAAPAASNSVAAALQELRRTNSEASYKTAVSTLDKILSNIVENPMEEKYRNLKVNNPAFQRRFGALPGAEAVMLACGFARQDRSPASSEGGEGAAAAVEPYYVMQASADNWPRLLETHGAVKALAARVSSVAASGLPASMHQPPSLPWGGAPGAPAGMGGLPLAQSRAVESLMSDPANLQQMLQHPMVQAMMRNDPRFSSNPMLRQVMDELANNPQAAQQVASMMSDPAMRTMMDQAMRQAAAGGGGGDGGAGAGLGGLPWGGGGGAGAGLGGLPWGGGGAGLGGVPPSRPAGGAPSQPPQQQQGGASDEDLTEEEMIAEAIRRSLQDGA